MRMLDRSGVGCPMCKRLPVPNDDDMTWMRAGQPLISLIADAYAQQRAKERAAEEEKAAAEAAAEAAAAVPDEQKDAVDLMNSAMDDLEKLFGFGDAPEPEEIEEPEPEPVEEEEYEPVTTADTKLDPMMYHYKDADYLVTGHRDLEIQYCPFCGSKLSVIE